jgi:hypothetical protein
MSCAVLILMYIYKQTLAEGTFALPCPQMSSSLDLPRLLTHYADRNVSTVFHNKYPIWQVRDEHGTGSIVQVEVLHRVQCFGCSLTSSN